MARRGGPPRSLRCVRVADTRSDLQTPQRLRDGCAEEHQNTSCAASPPRDRERRSQPVPEPFDSTKDFVDDVSNRLCGVYRNAVRRVFTRLMQTKDEVPLS